MDDLEKIIEKCGGIQPPHLAFYTRAIHFNVESAMSSIDFLASFIEATNETNGDYEMTGELQNGILDNLQKIIKTPMLKTPPFGRLEKINTTTILILIAYLE